MAHRLHVGRIRPRKRWGRVRATHGHEAIVCCVGSLQHCMMYPMLLGRGRLPNSESSRGSKSTWWRGPRLGNSKIEPYLYSLMESSSALIHSTFITACEPGFGHRYAVPSDPLQIALATPRLENSPTWTDDSRPTRMRQWYPKASKSGSNYGMPQASSPTPCKRRKKTTRLVSHSDSDMQIWNLLW
jgi:hypothetical protein